MSGDRGSTADADADADSAQTWWTQTRLRASRARLSGPQMAMATAGIERWYRMGRQLMLVYFVSSMVLFGVLPVQLVVIYLTLG